MFITMIKGVEFMKANPSAVAKIQKDRQTFVRNKPRMCTGIHAIGTSTLPEDALNVEADDQPLLTFDNNGYICHLTDEYDVHDSDDLSSSGELSVHSNPFDPLMTLVMLTRHTIPTWKSTLLITSLIIMKLMAPRYMRLLGN